ncbi:hypothetical protein B0H13DRAFT_2551613 [Mycena leptocephala]|nr:hypothetical protein B0H13DRAFT_2551613 [Mycena leptocephala]
MNRLNRDDVGFLQPGSTRRRVYEMLQLDYIEQVRDFYPYLFYFNPGDYSITALYLPPSTAFEPALKSHGSIKIGAGSCGSVLKFSPGSHGSDGGFFKLIVCTRKVNLGHIAQASPFRKTSKIVPPAVTYDNSDRMMLDVVSEMPPELWSTSLVAVTLRKRPWRFGLKLGGRHH